MAYQWDWVCLLRVCGLQRREQWDPHFQRVVSMTVLDTCEQVMLVHLETGFYFPHNLWHAGKAEGLDRMT